MQFSFGPPLREGVLDIASFQPLNRQRQLSLGEQLVLVACPKISCGDQERECAQKDRETSERE